MKNVTPGARGRAELTVEFDQTLTKHHDSLPPVLSTPNMIGLMETAAYCALHDYQDEGEITVGTAINIEHLAACTVGSQVTAEAELERIEGKLYIFRVSARARQNGDEFEIGRGTVTRAFINVDRFMKKLQQKA